MSPLSFAVLAYSLVATPEVPPRAVPLEPWVRAVLSKDDKKFLDSLLKDLVCDPKNALRVWFEAPAYQIPSHSNLRSFGEQLRRKVTAEGWLVRGKKGEKDRIYLVDGQSIPVPEGKITPVDYFGEIKSRFSGEVGFDPEIEIGECDITRAAWLHRIGFDGLAALLLKGPVKKSREEIRKDFAQRARFSAIQAYCARADAEAIHHFDRLHKTYSDLTKEALPHFEPILADLKRRKALGTFGKQPEKDWPSGFATWDVKRRVDYIIQSLDEVDGTLPEAQSDNWNGRDNFTRDRRFQALVEIGDAAIPALIRTIESDERLTRFADVHVAHRDQIDLCPIYSVRDVAEQAVWDILRTDKFTPSRQRDDVPANVRADRLRKYWAKYGHLPFIERMMNILCDRSARKRDRSEAASNLARENTRLYSTDRYRGQSWHRDEQERTRNVPRLTPLALQFKSPSIAEAILLAMNDEFDWLKDQDDRFEYWERSEDQYVACLVMLGDYRIVSELVRRAATSQTIKQRLRYITACQSLGLNSTLIQVARELATGTIWWSRMQLRHDDSMRDVANIGLGKVLSSMSDSTLPEAKDALEAVADIHHPYFAMAADQAMNGRDDVFGPSWMANNAFRLEILRKCLKNQTLTGTQFFLRGTEIQSLSREGESSKSPLRDHPASAEWFERADERVCDKAAAVIANRCLGMPLCSPLRKDRDQVLLEIDDTITRFNPRWRSVDFEEKLRFTGWPRNNLFVNLMICGNHREPPPPAIPLMKPLGRPATPADVKAGRAIFELAGKGKVAEEKLPAWLLLKSESKEKAPAYGLVVQAEVGPDGKPVYGVIFRHDIRAVKAEEVERIELYERK